MKIALLSPGALAGAASVGLATLASLSPLKAGDLGATAPETKTSPSALSEWWNGKYATGNWFGFRDTLEDHGLKFKSKWTGVYYGLVDGGTDDIPGSFFDQQIKFSAQINFKKALNLDALKGLKGFVEVRYQNGGDPNSGVGASMNFNPSDLQTFVGWKVMNAGLTYTTPELFGIKQFATLTGGWLQPQNEFINQPLSKQFVNNSFDSSKGIGANIPLSSSYSSWGGTLRLDPTDWFYAKGGLFLAYPLMKGKHGYSYRGFSSRKTQNGLFASLESGFTPYVGPSRLPGKYAAGAYSYGDWNTSFYGHRNFGHYGLYLQADQMLWRPANSNGKDSNTPVEHVSFEDPYSEKQRFSQKGLYFFSLFTLSPPYNNVLPFYFQTGLVYQGLIPTRDNDRLMAGFSFAEYSINNINALQDDNNPNQPNYSAALELDYRFQINRWSYVQPYLQYIVKPNGTGAVENATVMGFEVGVYF